MKKLRIISLVALLITVFVTMDLGLNLFYNMSEQFNDGLTVNSLLHAFFRIFGDSLWSMERFFNAFEVSIWITFAVFTENVILAIMGLEQNKS